MDVASRAREFLIRIRKLALDKRGKIIHFEILSHTGGNGEEVGVRVARAALQTKPCDQGEITRDKVFTRDGDDSRIPENAVPVTHIETERAGFQACASSGGKSAADAEHHDHSRNN